jgi:hypothetical protein
MDMYALLLAALCIAWAGTPMDSGCAVCGSRAAHLMRAPPAATPVEVVGRHPTGFL